MKANPGEFIGVVKLCYHCKPCNTLYHCNKPLSLSASFFLAGYPYAVVTCNIFLLAYIQYAFTVFCLQINRWKNLQYKVPNIESKYLPHKTVFFCISL